MLAERGLVSNLGDHGDFEPIYQKVATTVRRIIAIPIFQGRLNGLLSPVLCRIGREIRIIPMTTGLKAITNDSIWGGMRAKSAKIHIKYQSGRGFAFILAGSGGAPISGGPKIRARRKIPVTTMMPKVASRQAASGQNGTPFSASI